jgi:hypothetical protein
MNTRFAAISFAAAILILRGTAIGSLPNPEELAYAAPAIGYYVVEVRHWACKYEWIEQRRSGNTIVYRVTFRSQEKCSRSKRDEYFDLFYDAKLHKVSKMVPAK